MSTIEYLRKYRGNHVVPTEWAEQLERERDEARTTLTEIHRWIERNHPDGFIDALTFSQNLERVVDRWYDRLDKVERERDEARHEIEGWRNKWDCAVTMGAKTEIERDDARELAFRFRSMYYTKLGSHGKNKND